MYFTKNGLFKSLSTPVKVRNTLNSNPRTISFHTCHFLWLHLCTKRSINIASFFKCASFFWRETDNNMTFKGNKSNAIFSLKIWLQILYHNLNLRCSKYLILRLGALRTFQLSCRAQQIPFKVLSRTRI